MSRTLLFLVVLAALVCVSLSAPNRAVNDHGYSAEDGKTTSGGSYNTGGKDSGNGGSSGKDNGSGNSGKDNGNGDGNDGNGGSNGSNGNGDGNDGNGDGNDGNGGNGDGNDGNGDGNDGNGDGNDNGDGKDGNDDDDDGHSPVDCCVSAWTTWGACTKTCGGGYKVHTRYVTVQPAYGGAPCPPLTENVPCNTQACSRPPVNCEVGGWSSWGSCSKSCGTGSRSRNRVVTTQPAYGGTPCPPLTETSACNTQYCPVHCQMNEWQSWGACSKTCGGGTYVRSRTCRTPAAYGGNACPASSESGACNTQACRRY